jgi:hypothetical protein
MLAKPFRKWLSHASADIKKPHDRKKDRSSTKFEKDGCYTKFGGRCIKRST